MDLSHELERPGVDAKNLVKHMAFSTLLSINQKFGKEYGKMVLCADAETYWRRDYFQWYKGHRKHAKEKSKIDWDIVYASIKEVKKDLREHFPYVLLEVDNCEADDIIACMVKYLQSNELFQEGLIIDEPQKIVVVSGDGDFLSLQKYKNVIQWDNQRKRFLKSVNPRNELLEKIARGDDGDNICSVLTSDDWSKRRAENTIERVKQSPMTKAILAEFVDKGIDACKNDEQRKNYIRNQTLIDFEFIPENINTSIVEAYVNYEKRGSKAKLMAFFSSNRMRILLENINGF
jgi:hypothetical protein